MTKMPERNTTAFIYADLNKDIWNRPSRIATPMAGIPVLCRTIGQLERCEVFTEIIIFCPSEQQQQIKTLVSETSAVVLPLRQPVPDNKRIARRKWSLRNWRGGMHEATVYDEQQFTPEMIQIMRDRDIFTAVNCPAEAVLLAVDLVQDHIEYHYSIGEKMRFSFSQAGVGLGISPYRMDLLHELNLTHSYVGDLLYYNPVAPQADMIVEQCNFKVDPKLYSTRFRYIADNKRSFDAIETLIKQANDEQVDWPALKLIETMDSQLSQGEPMPQELVLEITNTPSLRMDGYPHNHMPTPRANMTISQFESIIDQIEGYDDICLTFGGFGEPLAHPDLPQMIRIAKEKGIFGINIETDGTLLQGNLADELLAAHPDAISIFLDAHTEETYQAVKGQSPAQGTFTKITEQIDEFLNKKTTETPYVIPHFTKIRANMNDMEDFYDHWLRRCGMAVITGYSDFAGQIPSRAIMNMASPNRSHCKRLLSTLAIYADGTVSICDQDFALKSPVGNINKNTIKEIWNSETLRQLQQDHINHQFENNQLCKSCNEWHR